MTTVPCCPECEACSGQIGERTSVSPRYRCTQCGETFDELGERQPKRLADRLKRIGETA